MKSEWKESFCTLRLPTAGCNCSCSSFHDASVLLCQHYRLRIAVSVASAHARRRIGPSRRSVSEGVRSFPRAPRCFPSLTFLDGLGRGVFVARGAAQSHLPKFFVMYRYIRNFCFVRNGCPVPKNNPSMQRGRRITSSPTPKEFRSYPSR